MSRVGKLPIQIPAAVQVGHKGRVVSIEGPRGRECHELPEKITIEIADGAIHVRRQTEDRRTRALHGLNRKLLANIVTGLSEGFTKALEIVGVGYRAEVKDGSLHLNLGYSHPVVYGLPKGVQAKVEKQTKITLEANNKQLLGEVAAQIRALRPPEPYKGKGVKYADEQIRRKAGKTAGK